MAGQDIRVGDRQATSMRIKLKYPDVETFIQKYAVNISRGGIFIATKQPKPVGTFVKFEFLLSNAESQSIIRGEGQVQWTKEFDPAYPARAHGMGVKFIRLDAESQGVVDRALRWRAEHGTSPNATMPTASTGSSAHATVTLREASESRRLPSQDLADSEESTTRRRQSERIDLADAEEAPTSVREPSHADKLPPGDAGTEPERAQLGQHDDRRDEENRRNEELRRNEASARDESNRREEISRRDEANRREEVRLRDEARLREETRVRDESNRQEMNRRDEANRRDGMSSSPTEAMGWHNAATGNEDVTMRHDEAASRRAQAALPSVTSPSPAIESATPPLLLGRREETRPIAIQHDDDDGRGRALHDETRPIPLTGSAAVRARGGDEIDALASEWGLSEEKLARSLKRARPRMAEATAELERLLLKPPRPPAPSKAEAMTQLALLLAKRSGKGREHVGNGAGALDKAVGGGAEGVGARDPGVGDGVGAGGGSDGSSPDGAERDESAGDPAAIESAQDRLRGAR